MSIATLKTLLRRFASRRAQYLLGGLVLVAICVSTPVVVVRERAARTAARSEDASPAAKSETPEPPASPTPVQAAALSKADPAHRAAPAAVTSLAKVRPSAEPRHMASAGAAQPATGALATEYTDNLDAQLSGIASLVKEQLTSGKGATSDRAEKAAATFADSLRAVVKEPLTRQRFKDIVASLHRRHFWLIDPYPDITDLEIEYYRLRWTGFIEQYLARQPMTPQQKLVLARQVLSLVATARSAMERSFDQSETAGIPRLLRELFYLFYLEFNDPVLPAMKRPFSQQEMDELGAWLREKIPDVMQRWHTRSDYEPGHAEHALASGGIIGSVYARIWKMLPSVSPLSRHLAERMHAERSAMLRAQSKWFDSLPEPEKEREWKRMSQERERANAQTERVWQEEEQQFQGTLRALEDQGGQG